MSIIHLIVGDYTAKPLVEAVALDESMGGTVVVLKDILHVGLLKTDGLTFSEGRSAFWNKVVEQPHTDIVVDDLERLMEVSSRLSNEEDLKIWFWMAPTPADVSAYFWLLHFLKKHQGRFFVLNVNGLPFLDENSKLFYPESIGHIPVKEFSKAKKLARVVTRSEWESDIDEWSRLLTENTGIRVFEGGKKLKGVDIDFYDNYLLEAITLQNQKMSRLVNSVMTKMKIPTGDTFLFWRLNQLAEAGLIEVTKTDVRLKPSVQEIAISESSKDTDVDGKTE